MAVTREEIQDLIAAGDLSTLFLTRLHWDNPRSQPDFYGSDGLPIPGTDLTAFPLASKRVVDLWLVHHKSIPPRTEIRRTVTTLRKQHSLEMLIVFEADDGQMSWLWPEQRRTGNGFQLVEYPSHRNSIDSKMLGRLMELRFDPEEEDRLTSTSVLARVRLSLDVDLAGMEKEVERTISSAVGHLSSDPGVSEKIGQILYQEPGEQTNKMAIAVLFNAVVFQHHIASRHKGVPTPEALRSEGLPKADVEAAWDAVLEINYWPIFGIARDLLTSITDNAMADKVLGDLFSRAAETTAYRDTQGIIGELYGRLVADRAFLKTHYTRLGSAAFLAEMAVDRLELDWSDPKQVTRLRVADLACGTGALLTAAYRRIAARHEEAGGDPMAIHQQMMENVLIGCDIMPASVHLTAAMLSGEHPGVGYHHTKTWVMPFGMINLGMGEEAKVGSLDLLGGSQRAALYGDGAVATLAHDAPARSRAHVPTAGMDLIIMNPPFGRPTNHERKEGAEEDEMMPPIPVFAGMGNDEEAQRLMSTALKTLYKATRGPTAKHGNAGMVTNFMDLAHLKLRPGGVLALIVPATFVSGASWAKMRELLTEHYRDIHITTLTSTETAEARAFSDDTDMAEAVIVAVKRQLNEHRVQKARYICLRERPESPNAGIDVARAVRPKGDLDSPGGSPLGFAVVSNFSPDAGGHPSGVVNPEICGIGAALTAGCIRLPQISRFTQVPITDLGEMGIRGPYSLDINGRRGRGPFDVVQQAQRLISPKAPFPVLWRHDHNQEKKMTVLPCSHGFVRAGMESKARNLWNGYTNAKGQRIAAATRLHINEGFRLTSQALGACFTPVPAIGGMAWPSLQVEPPNPEDCEKWEKALCVWLNSTLGLLSRWWMSSRQQPGRARLSVTTIGNIPVLDLRKLTPHRLNAASAVFDSFAEREFLPANEAYRDPARADLDRALAKRVLYLPASAVEGIARLRLMWCSEPSVHGNKKTRPGGPAGS